MAELHKRKLPMAQHELLDWLHGAGRRMARSTLNYHLLALEHANYITRRSYRPKYVSGEFRQRVTVYSLGLRAQQWIRLWTSAGPEPAARAPSVRKSGHIRRLFKSTGGVGGTAGEKFTSARKARRRTRAPR